MQWETCLLASPSRSFQFPLSRNSEIPVTNSGEYLEAGEVLSRANERRGKERLQKTRDRICFLQAGTFFSSLLIVDLLLCAWSCMSQDVAEARRPMVRFQTPDFFLGRPRDDDLRHWGPIGVVSGVSNVGLRFIFFWSSYRIH